MGVTTCKLTLSQDLMLINEDWPSYQPNVDSEDVVEWVLTSNKMYSVKSAWNSIRRSGDVVSWFRLVWQKNAISRCSFIYRLVCKNRMKTKDRVKRWVVVIRDSTGVLYRKLRRQGILAAILLMFGVRCCKGTDAIVGRRNLIKQKEDIEETP